jgi:uncharacterized membrane protein YfcA
MTLELYEVGLFVASGFAAALIAGLAGFAFGLVAAAAWLHILTPLQTTTLIVVFGLVIQGYAVWKLRASLRWERLWPFLLGGVVGVPIGVDLLRGANPTYVRIAVGILLIAFVAYALARPAARVKGNAGADGGVGLLSGVLGGITGLGGILPTIWCTLRGWPKDEQRAVFQPTGVVIFVATIACLGFSGSVSKETLKLIAIGLPAVIIGVWLGLKLYGAVSEKGFRILVLALLFVSGVTLLIR